MPIALKLATRNTPEPWQAAGLETPALEYAREGLPTARPRSFLRGCGALCMLLLRAAGWLIGGALLLVAFALLLAGGALRLALAGLARGLLFLRKANVTGLYERLRYGRRVEYAQVA